MSDVADYITHRDDLMEDKRRLVQAGTASAFGGGQASPPKPSPEDEPDGVAPPRWQ